MQKIIDLNKEKEERDRIKREKGSKILDEHQKNIEGYEAYLNRLDMKEAAGKALNEKDIAGLLREMGKLAESDRKKTDKLNELYGENKFKTVIDHIEEEWDIECPDM